jgi:hypothetical protein
MPPADTEFLERMAQALQLGLGMVFLLAVLPKLRAPRAVARTVARYRLGPPALAPVVARALIAVEAFLALSLLTGMVVAVALPLAIVTLSGFAIAVGINLRRDRRIPWGCFGTGEEPISRRSLVRLAMLLVAAMFSLFVFGTPGAAPISLTGGRAPEIGQAVEVVGLSVGLLLLAMWLLHLPELWSVVRDLWRPLLGPEAGQRREEA